MMTQISIVRQIATSDKGVGEKVDRRGCIKALTGVRMVLCTISMIVDNQRAASLVEG